ncbi:MAG: hypothetical protein IJ509_02445 [Bacilli bacterium]|nr:hypothetical protein [Bacilli bacterium]
MKRKILISILCLLVILVIALTATKFIFNSPDDTSDNNPTIEPTVSPDKTIELCVDKDNCPIMANTFSYVAYDYENQEMQQWIENINAETEQYYQEVLNSNTSDDSCSNIREIYNHSISVRTNHTIYTNDKYISFAFERIKQNLCTNISESLPIKTFIYDKEKEKEITQEELMKEFNITDADIDESIKENIKEANKITNGNLTIEDIYINNKINYILYFNGEGAIIVAYYHPAEKAYYYATI